VSYPDIGVVLDSFGQPVKEALQSASRLAFRHVEMAATSTEVDPTNLSHTGRRDLMHYVSGLGLQLSALGADLGGVRFNDRSGLERRLDKTRQILELAAELRTPMVTTHLGRVDEQTLKQGYVTDALSFLADVADKTGTYIAFETGSAEPQCIAALLRETGCQSLGICYDPASLLIDGLDPLAGVDPLADRILIARARDAIAGSGQRPGRETPIGRGQIDMAEYLAALDQAGYRNTTFLRRNHADKPLQEIADAKKFIELLFR